MSAIIDFAEPKIIKSGSNYSVVHGDDSGIFAEFYYKPIQDMEATQEQGRPIFNDVVFLRARIAGDKTTVVERVARDADKQRFARQWEAFNAKEDQKILGGMPLKEWPMITNSMILELNALGVFTVEKFCELDDRFFAQNPGYRELQKKAENMLNGNDEVAALKKRIEELEAQSQKKDQSYDCGVETPKKRGRPPKED